MNITEIKAHDAATYEMIIEKARTERNLEWAVHKLHDEVGDSKLNRNGSRSYADRTWGLTDQEAFDIARAVAADPRANYRHADSFKDDDASYVNYIATKFAEVADEVIALQDEIKGLAASIHAQEEVFNTERWSRFEMVPGGHIHNRNYTCHTLRPTTQVAWIPKLSGDTVEDAVATYGPALCSHCYKDAPVEWQQKAKVQKTTNSRGEVVVATLAQAQAIADEKAEAKRIREEKKAAKEARAAARAAR